MGGVTQMRVVPPPPPTPPGGMGEHCNIPPCILVPILMDYWSSVPMASLVPVQQDEVNYNYTQLKIQKGEVAYRVCDLTSTHLLWACLFHWMPYEIGKFPMTSFDGRGRQSSAPQCQHWAPWGSRRWWALKGTRTALLGCRDNAAVCGRERDVERRENPNHKCPYTQCTCAHEYVNTWRKCKFTVCTHVYVCACVIYVLHVYVCCLCNLCMPACVCMYAHMCACVCMHCMCVHVYCAHMQIVRAYTWLVLVHVKLYVQCYWPLLYDRWPQSLHVLTNGSLEVSTDCEAAHLCHPWEWSGEERGKEEGVRKILI